MDAAEFVLGVVYPPGEEPEKCEAEKTRGKVLTCYSMTAEREMAARGAVLNAAMCSPRSGRQKELRGDLNQVDERVSCRGINFYRDSASIRVSFFFSASAAKGSSEDA
jgi:hypothetical protein